MRNFIRVSQNREIDHRPATNPSSDMNLKPNENYDDFGAELNIPPDVITDVFLITYDISDLVIDDLIEYLNSNGDENRVTNDEEETGLDIPTDEINNDFLKVVHRESDVFLNKITDDVSSFFDEFDDDKGELLVTQETDSNLREGGVRVKDGDHDRACRVVDRQPLKRAKTGQELVVTQETNSNLREGGVRVKDGDPDRACRVVDRQLLKRTKTGQELTKSAVVKNLDEPDMEMKLMDVKRKIREAEEKKKRKIKVIDYISVPQPQTTTPKKPCKKKDCLSPRRNLALVYVPKKPRTCRSKKDELILRLENDYEHVPVPKKPRTSRKKKDHDLLRRNENTEGAGRN